MTKKFWIRLLIIVVLGLILGLTIWVSVRSDIKIKGGVSCPSDFHYSYFSSKSFFDDAYKNIPEDAKIKSEQPANIKGIIVNHHLLAPQLIAATIGYMATTAPVTVVLISPNHFFAGDSRIISSVYQWDMPYGILDSDCELVSKLANEGVVSIEEKPFEKEHGISGIVSFIKKTLPNAKVVPIIIKENLGENDLNKFVDTLYKLGGDNVVLIGSYDFSHYVPASIAEKQDAKSLEIIRSFDLTKLGSVSVDSRPGLEIVLKYLKKMNALKFTLIANTNSGILLHAPVSAEVTSYIDGFFTAP